MHQDGTEPDDGKQTMATVRINIDFQRSQQIGIPVGNVDAEIVRQFIDDRGRDRVTVRVNGCDFAVAMPKAVNNTPTVFATQEELVAEYNADRRYRRSLARAGGDATLLRR